MLLQDTELDTVSQATCAGGGNFGSQDHNYYKA
jgi:hypothetical protein